MVSSYICKLSLHPEVYHSDHLKKIKKFCFVYKNFIMISTIVLPNYPQLALQQPHTGYIFNALLSQSKKCHHDMTDVLLNHTCQVSSSQQKVQVHCHRLFCYRCPSHTDPTANPGHPAGHRPLCCLLSSFCVLYYAFTAHLIFVDLALGLRAHSSADGLMTSLLTSL